MFSMPLLVIAFLAFVFVMSGFKIIPQQQVWIVEKLGRFDRKLEPGLNIIIPFIERVAYRHSLKEEAIDISEQAAITKDNVTLLLDGIIYLKKIDPVAASYGAANPFYAVIQLAQTTMRSEIGKMTMDQTFEEREALNTSIVNAINEAANSWGVQCMRYEIKDIAPPKSVLQAMELQVAAERKKRAEILESEGKKQAKINIAEADRAQVVLESEAAQIDQINRARGEADAIKLVAAATANSIEIVAKSINEKGGESAVALKVAERYIEAFSNIAKVGNSIIIPANASDAGSMVAQALAVFNTVKVKAGKNKHIAENPWEDKA
jgi:regulator of protease activity HflC (stomatin/prohibitin superfamily)